MKGEPGTGSRFRAIVLDFDGLILETEEPIHTSWSELYAVHGESLPMSLWADVIGRSGNYFDPRVELERRLGRSLPDELFERRRERRLEMIMALDVMPGVRERTAEAKSLGMLTAVASSSTRTWVCGHLERLGLTGMDCVRTREDVEEAKPAPDLYLAVCAGLGIEPREAIAFEDSRNGLLAARAAGLACVAVPTAMTRGMDFREADLIIPSLARVTISELTAALP